MLFNFEVVYKTDDSAKYKIGGSLSPEFVDRELFEQVKDAYREVLLKEGVSFKDKLVIKDECILFADIDIVSISNILKVLSSNLDFKINTSVSKNCKFIPSSCEPLFRMEVHRLFI